MNSTSRAELRYTLWHYLTPTVLSEVHQTFEGDAFFPMLNETEFELVSTETIQAVIPYTHSVYDYAKRLTIPSTGRQNAAHFGSLRCAPALVTSNVSTTETQLGFLCGRIIVTN